MQEHVQGVLKHESEGKDVRSGGVTNRQRKLFSWMLDGTTRLQDLGNGD